MSEESGWAFIVCGCGGLKWDLSGIRDLGWALIRVSNFHLMLFGLCSRCLKCKLTSQHIQTGPWQWQLPRGGNQLIVLKNFLVIALNTTARGTGRRCGTFPHSFSGSLWMRASATFESKTLFGLRSQDQPHWSAMRVAVCAVL